ncbi:methyltransferase domain-containing protein [Pseudonocardia sp.]|uniref:methyltransferase domain-containing protein n=1 Tax=Pseudonocardia sp. TaxID=60912 RepID=UPI0026070DEF|nr:methyltransferase domain-containing protein [Pseudonocardia sp.]
MTTGDTGSAPAPAIDGAKVEAFAGRMLSTYTEGMVTLMIDLAHRTGILESLAAGPGTSEQIAARAGLVERYVRECLGALTTAGILDYDAAAARYTLPAEHAVCLTGAGSMNLAPFARINTLLGTHLPAVAAATRDGGGVPYEKVRPEFTEVMDAMSRGLMDDQLIDGVLPVTGELPDRLAAGIRVVDIGCGTGHTTNLLARAYPASTFVGYDISPDAIGAARAEAAEWELPNVTFELLDVTDLPTEPPIDAAFAFDAIHDQVDPATVLEKVHAALVPGGVFVMVDIKASSHLENNVGNPFAPWLYGVSTLHCMTVSLAHGGAGLGTVWGEERAVAMLADAGFVDTEVHDVPDDPFDSVYVTHRPRR